MESDARHGVAGVIRGFHAGPAVHADDVAIGFVQVRPGKSREIAVGRTECRAVLDGDRCQSRVHDQRARCLTFAGELLQDLPMPLAGFEDSG